MERNNARTNRIPRGRNAQCQTAIPVRLEIEDGAIEAIFLLAIVNQHSNVPI